MSFLVSALKIILIASGVFFLVFAYFCSKWTDRDIKKGRTLLAGATVSFLYTFKIFIWSFLILFIISFFIDKPLTF